MRFIFFFSCYFFIGMCKNRCFTWGETKRCVEFFNNASNWEVAWQLYTTYSHNVFSLGSSELNGSHYIQLSCLHWKSTSLTVCRVHYGFLLAVKFLAVLWFLQVGPCLPCYLNGSLKCFTTMVQNIISETNTYLKKKKNTTFVFKLHSWLWGWYESLLSWLTFIIRIDAVVWLNWLHIEKCLWWM